MATGGFWRGKGMGTPEKPTNRGGSFNRASNALADQRYREAQLKTNEVETSVVAPKTETESLQSSRGPEASEAV